MRLAGLSCTDLQSKQDTENKETSHSWIDTGAHNSRSRMAFDYAVIADF